MEAINAIKANLNDSNYANRFKMAILDLNMPGMNGREIAKQIREEEQRLGI